ncbi:hypothetical protein CPAR01_10132 [Colletotrichum paranaense]|uniref:Uncharacterized protein n=3 Tax=Colletotrichum acutatum species complex TaxID=2707335 RepID=A0AAI9YKF1_9PEZI|nr:uncharacterized protein CCOS01_14475 [Colletotrichum costaricense]XP_060346577.1 uncharacterized protein CPAR01_10132 [Colletotrichum paranaense]KAK1458010.1 hypothetical protein CMEL01_15357 [Colletotrichum melonis]KAK1513533.1 hypothetical protein CCOS01_14475 [Colletotrichum costaricense]KAK1533424.1 hypothetical protein CPAR01_10132 [Colletotrichum paranaense]
MKLAPVLSILVAGLSFASAQVCPDKNLMECYEYCDFNNKPNDAWVGEAGLVGRYTGTQYMTIPA